MRLALRAGMRSTLMREWTVTPGLIGPKLRLTGLTEQGILVAGRSSVFGLSHLFYPWGFLVQIFAIVHFVRRRPENYWFYVIFFGGWIGAAVYIAVEVIPDLGLLRGVFQGFGRRSRIQTVEA